MKMLYSYPFTLSLKLKIFLQLDSLKNQKQKIGHNFWRRLYIYIYIYIYTYTHTHIYIYIYSSPKVMAFFVFDWLYIYIYAYSKRMSGNENYVTHMIFHIYILNTTIQFFREKNKPPDVVKSRSCENRRRIALRYEWRNDSGMSVKF